LITILVPILLLAGTELALRLAGVGKLEPLFIPVPGNAAYLQPNPDVMQRFFPDPAQAPDVSIDTTWFPRDKAAGTLRIFVQGESSAAGFPYGRWASPAALLQQRLQRSLPDRNVEVISTAMAAVTSYTLLDFADEILEQRPDAIVVYTGHNEYLGVGGVGSSLVSAKSPTAARLIAQLRRLHLYRGLERLVSSIGPRPSSFSEGDGTLMSRVARERSIPFGSALYEQGVAQFRGNLESLLRKYRSAGVPVFIGTLASNERDQLPFVSGAPGESGGTAAEHFEQARRLEAAGKTREARAEYLAAKDRDQLRFRAPEAFNELIREVAGERGGTVVESQAALVAAATRGIIGNELMLEHVHPNVTGYFHLAGAFYRLIIDSALVKSLGSRVVRIDDATAMREVPVTEIDRLNGEHRVEVLRNDWPFVPERRPVEFPAPTNEIERLAMAWFAGRLSWGDAMSNALAEYQKQGNTAEAARVAVNLADGFVSSDRNQYIAGRLLLRDGQDERSLRYLQRAVQINPEPIEYSMSLAEALFKLGRREESIRILEQVLERHPGEERAEYWLGQLRESAT
jgi:tetratricopeptide (TPR) repeat protein